MRQGAGQVDGHGAFAHPAFAAAHGDHLLDALDGLARLTLAMAGGSDGRSFAGLGQLDLNAVNAVEGLQAAARLGRNAVPLTLGKARQREAKHRPAAL